MYSNCSAGLLLSYRLTVTWMDNCNCETYTGVTAGTFKCRWYGHCHDMTHRPDEEHQGTTLSNHVWKLKDQNVQYKIDWAVVTKVLTLTLQLAFAGFAWKKNFSLCFVQRGPHWTKDQSSSLTADISINFYLPLLLQKKQHKTEKEKPREDENLQHIYTYLFLFNSRMVGISNFEEIFIWRLLLK